MPLITVVRLRYALFVTRYLLFDIRYLLSNLYLNLEPIMSTAAERTVVTKEAVFTECNRLKGEGVRPTVRKLLQALGGSATTIAAFLREWRDEESVSVPEPVEIAELPLAVMEAATQAARAVWQVCVADSRHEIQQVNEQAADRVKKAEASREEAEVDLGESEAELKEARVQLSELDVELASLRNVITQAASIEAGLKATIEQMAHQIDAQTEEMKRVHSESDAARQTHAAELVRINADFARQLGDQVDANRQALADTAAVRSRLEEQGRELYQALERERVAAVAVAKAQGETVRIAAERDQLQADVRKAGLLEADLRGEREELRRQLADAYHQAATLTAQRDAAGSERDTLRAQLAEVNTQVSALTGQRDAASAERDALRAQVASQTEIITELSQRGHKT